MTYPVTKEELEQIRRNCVKPKGNDCDCCSYRDNENEECSYNGADVLITKILSRKDIKTPPIICPLHDTQPNVWYKNINLSQGDPSYIVKGSELVQLCFHHIHDELIMLVERDIRAREIKESIFHPDCLALLEAWITFRYYERLSRGNVRFDAYGDLVRLIKQLRNSPESVIEQGISEGWWNP